MQAEANSYKWEFNLVEDKNASYIFEIFCLSLKLCNQKWNPVGEIQFWFCFVRTIFENRMENVLGESKKKEPTLII